MLFWISYCGTKAESRGMAQMWLWLIFLASLAVDKAGGGALTLVGLPCLRGMCMGKEGKGCGSNPELLERFHETGL